MLTVPRALVIGDKTLIMNGPITFDINMKVCKMNEGTCSCSKELTVKTVVWWCGCDVTCSEGKGIMNDANTHTYGTVVWKRNRYVHILGSAN